MGQSLSKCLGRWFWWNFNSLSRSRGLGNRYLPQLLLDTPSQEKTCLRQPQLAMACHQLWVVVETEEIGSSDRRVVLKNCQQNCQQKHWHRYLTGLWHVSTKSNCLLLSFSGHVVRGLASMIIGSLKAAKCDPGFSVAVLTLLLKKPTF